MPPASHASCLFPVSLTFSRTHAERSVMWQKPSYWRHADISLRATLREKQGAWSDGSDIKISLSSSFFKKGQWKAHCVTSTRPPALVAVHLPSPVWLSVILWGAARQASLSLGRFILFNPQLIEVGVLTIPLHLQEDCNIERLRPMPKKTWFVSDRAGQGGQEIWS